MKKFAVFAPVWCCALPAAQEQDVKVFPPLGHSSTVYSVAFSPDGKQILSGSTDSTVRLWDAVTGAELAQLVSFDDGEWVCITPEGYYNASPKGDQHLNVQVGSSVYGIDQYRDSFYKPAIVALALSGDSAACLAAIKSGPAIQDTTLAPPEVLILSPANGTNLAQDRWKSPLR